MRRILLVLSVAALMAVMLVASAMPAFAAPNCADGQHKAHSNAGEKYLQTGDAKYLEQNDKHFAMEHDGCNDGVPPGQTVN